jgi:hypothetical protein
MMKSTGFAPFVMLITTRLARGHGLDRLTKFTTNVVSICVTATIDHHAKYSVFLSGMFAPIETDLHEPNDCYNLDNGEQELRFTVTFDTEQIDTDNDH